MMRSAPISLAIRMISLYTTPSATVLYMHLGRHMLLLMNACKRLLVSSTILLPKFSGKIATDQWHAEIRHYGDYMQARIECLAILNDGRQHIDPRTMS